MLHVFCRVDRSGGAAGSVGLLCSMSWGRRHSCRRCVGAGRCQWQSAQGCLDVHGWNAGNRLHIEGHFFSLINGGAHVYNKTTTKRFINFVVLQLKRLKGLNAVYISSQEPISELRSVTCNMWSNSVIFHSTHSTFHTFHSRWKFFISAPTREIDLSTLDGSKFQLSLEFYCSMCKHLQRNICRFFARL